VPDWLRPLVSELLLPVLLPVAPLLVLALPVVCANAVAVPSRRIIVDAKRARRGENDLFDVEGFIAGALYAPGFVAPSEEGMFASPARLRQEWCDFSDKGRPGGHLDCVLIVTSQRDQRARRCSSVTASNSANESPRSVAAKACA
jgi:hypothetical protein